MHVCIREYFCTLACACTCGACGCVCAFACPKLMLGINFHHEAGFLNPVPIWQLWLASLANFSEDPQPPGISMVSGHPNSSSQTCAISIHLAVSPALPCFTRHCLSLALDSLFSLAGQLAPAFLHVFWGGGNQMWVLLMFPGRCFINGAIPPALCLVLE